MLEFKNLKEVEKANIIQETDISSVKISASNLRKEGFKIEGRPFWGIIVNLDDREVLISECDNEGEIFYHSSEEFIQKVINNLYEEGFLNLKLNNKSLIYIDADSNPYSYYGLFTKHNIYKKNDEKKKYGSANRLVTLGIDFLYDILFYQGVGPYPESNDKNVESLDNWVDERLNGKLLRQFHYSSFFKPYFPILSKGRDSEIREEREKIWSIFINESLALIDQSDETFKELIEVLNELSFKDFFKIKILSQRYSSFLAPLYSIKVGKDEGHYAALISALHHRTINYAEKNIEEFLEFPEEVSLDAVEDDLEEFLVLHQHEDEVNEALHNMQIQSVKESKEDFRNFQDFLNELYKDEIELERIAWLDEDNLLEFKASFKYDVNRKEHKPETEYRVIKAISALANSPGGGGTLVIGIWKERTQTGGQPIFIGIEKDGYQKKGGLADTDEWTLSVKQRLKQYTTLSSSDDFLDFSFVIRENKTFAIIKVKNKLPLIGTYDWKPEDKEKGINKGTILKDSTPIIFYRDGAQSIKADFEKSKDLEKRIQENLN